VAGATIKRWGLIALVALLLVGVGALVGLRFAAGLLKSKVVEGLGPGSEVRDIGVGFSGVVLEGVRIKGRAGWPAADTLRADRVAVAPSLLSLLSGDIRVRSITVGRPYLSVWRSRDGPLRLLPSLLERGPAGQPSAGPPAPPVRISRIRLREGAVELFDATVATPPLRVRLEQIDATVRDVPAPTLAGRTHFELKGILKGAQRDGPVSVGGWLGSGGRDASVRVRLRSVDLVALQPYLSQAAETRVRRGALDLDLQAEVRDSRLRAPGRAVISGLEFAPTRGVSDTFLGVPRTALVAFFKTGEDRIEVEFVLEGDVSNPRFTLQEALAARLASAVADRLGTSLRGIAEGVGKVGQKGIEAAGDVAREVGGALQQLFGGQKKR
jgi:hypothetical protein